MGMLDELATPALVVMLGVGFIAMMIFGMNVMMDKWIEEKRRVRPTTIQSPTED